MHSKLLFLLATLALTTSAIPAPGPIPALEEPATATVTPQYLVRRDAIPTSAPFIAHVEARAEQKPTTEKSATCLKCRNGKCCKRGLVAIAEPTPLVVRGWIVEEEQEEGVEKRYEHVEVSEAELIMPSRTVGGELI